MNNNIPMVDLKGQYRLLEAELKPVVESVMADAFYIKGPAVAAFEKEMSAFLDVPHAVACANGTDALHLALRGLGVGAGDEVITTSFTFVASAGTISLTGARPVFVDIDPASFNIDVNAIAAAITPRTRALVVVHLFGNPAPMDAIMELAGRHGLAVIEDCAQAAGATYHERYVGSIGSIGCFSFFPSKNLGCFGDGGMVVTRDADMAAHIRALADHGSHVKYHHDEIGFNSRLDTLQAAILRVKLKHLPEWNRQRRAVAKMYNERLAGSGVAVPQESAVGMHVYHQYTIRHAQRDHIQKQLQQAGVASAIYYPIPLHLQKMYQHLGYKEGSLPHAEAAAREVLSLPMYPEITQQIADRVTSGVRAALGQVVPT